MFAIHRISLALPKHGQLRPNTRAYSDSWNVSPDGEEMLEFPEESIAF